MTGSNPYRNLYTGTFLDIRLNHDNWIYLPTDLCATLSQRQKTGNLEGTISHIHGDITCLRIIDSKSGYKFIQYEEEDLKPIGLDYYHDVSRKHKLARIRIQTPLLNRAKLDPSRIFLAASEDGETFTLWRNEKWFEKAGSSCIPIDPGEQPNRRQIKHFYNSINSKQFTIMPDIKQS